MSYDTQVTPLWCISRSLNGVSAVSSGPLTLRMSLVQIQYRPLRPLDFLRRFAVSYFQVVG